jgi:hypothetical protein
MQITIAVRSYEFHGTEMLPPWDNKDKIAHYSRLADNGLGYKFLKRRVDAGRVTESIVWVPRQ